RALGGNQRDVSTCRTADPRGHRHPPVGGYAQRLPWTGHAVAAWTGRRQLQCHIGGSCEIRTTAAESIEDSGCREFFRVHDGLGQADLLVFAMRIATADRGDAPSLSQ